MSRLQIVRQWFERAHSECLVLVAPDRERGEQFVADVACQFVRSMPTSVLGLPTGTTFGGIYPKIVAGSKQYGVPWQNVQTFNMDQCFRVGEGNKLVPMPEESDLNYRGWMNRTFFDALVTQCGFRREAAFFPDLPPGATAESVGCRVPDYTEAILRAGGISLQLAGIGEADGHIAFDLPGSRPSDPSRIGALTTEVRGVHASQGTGVIEDTATHFVTIGMIELLAMVRNFVGVAFGAHKARILAKAFRIDQPTTDCPASFFAPWRRGFRKSVLWIVDQAAAAEIEGEPFVQLLGI